MNTTLTTCDHCEDQIDTESDVFYGSETNGGTYCRGCYESDVREASTVFLTGPDYPATSEGPVQVAVGQWFIEDRWLEPFTDLTFKRAYHSTDGWRGYIETTIEGWSEILGGWTTDGWGDSTARRKQPFNEWAESLFTGEIVPPVNVAVITDPTSNVFSTAIGVFVPNEHVETFTNWLNGELDNLRYALT